MDSFNEFNRYMAHLSEGFGHADRRVGLLCLCLDVIAAATGSSMIRVFQKLGKTFGEYHQPVLRPADSLSSTQKSGIFSHELLVELHLRFF